MSAFELLAVSLGLAMDATVASICKGLQIKDNLFKKTIVIALYFGFFQALMPTLGYFLGVTFTKVVSSVDHWIAFILLGVIGINMIREGVSKEEVVSDDGVDFMRMFPLAIATSIDALAVGITFAFLHVNLLVSISLIGIITFVLSFIGVIIGSKFGNRLGNISEIVGGVILILIGLKILLEHLKII